MSKTLSDELRERVLDAVAAGASCRAAAARFGIAPSTAVRWVKRFRETGDRRALPQGGDYRSQAIEAHADFILELVAARKDITLAEIVERLMTERAFACAQSTVWRFFSRRGFTFKKRQRMPANNSARMS
ncbi:Transposase [Roseibium album]|uniref:Transposase n=1 Tax=Roseibium album TaxID=311410 RepID=A0A0M6ZGH4_9HYPH|nr:Transposase [Roseibium album]CTQ65629.1 Transposase [Roseibium album]CTQ73679.1 Transposase [Roseibium album]